MKKLLWLLCTLSVALCSCGTAVKENSKHRCTTEMEKKNIGNLVTPYPKPLTVVSAEVGGKGPARHHSILQTESIISFNK